MNASQNHTQTTSKPEANASARPSRLLTALLAMALTALLLAGAAPADGRGSLQSVFDPVMAVR